MLVLHDYLPSQNGWKARVLMGLLGIEYRLQPVAIFSGESRTEAFLDRNPGGAIPALELGDGRTIAESNAILVYLARGSRYLPEDRFLDAATTNLRSPGLRPSIWRSGPSGCNAGA